MRTKALLLTAALSAAGVASSMAQVYSVNAVGYVNTTLLAGKFNLVSNPLDAADDKITTLFASVPDGTEVSKFVNGGFVTFAKEDGVFSTGVPANANLEVQPGEGVFVQPPPGANVTVTFVGEVPQGRLSINVPAGLSIRSSIVPQAGPLTGTAANSLQFPAQAGDEVSIWNEDTQRYTTYGFEDGEWLVNGVPSAPPTLGVGEAFFVSRATGGDWVRTFSVNQ